MAAKATVPVVTLRLPPLPAALATGANLAPTGTPGDAIRTTKRTFPTTRCRPRPTPPSLTMNGTTRTTTNGALRLGVKTETSMAPPPTERQRPPKTGRALAALLAAELAVTMAATVTDMVTILRRLATARSTATGGAHPRTPRPRAVPTTTTSGPSRLTAPTMTRDGASPTIPSPRSLTTTRATPEPFRPMTTNGLRTTTDTMPVTPTPEALPPPGGARRTLATTALPTKVPMEVSAMARATVAMPTV